MNEEHKNALIASLHDICQDLDAEDVLPYLRSKGTIKEGQAQDILKKTRKSTQNMQLVDFVKGAGSSAFQEFINVLHICNVKHLAAKILAHLPSSSTQQEISSEMSTGDILDTLVGFNNYQSYSVNSSVQATSSAETTSNDSNSGVQCRDLLGRIHSNHAAQRDIIINNYNGADGQHQSSSTSSSWSSQPTTEGWLQKLKSVQSSLKEMYLIRFKKVYPFSLPFTFDIVNTWVSLALKEEKKDSQATEDHAELLKRAFDQVNMLIIEGDPATGKTSLMRRLAYEWARKKEDNEMENCINATTSTLGKRKMNSSEKAGGKRTCMTYKRAKETEEILRYDLVIYAEFREVREKKFESVGELILSYSTNYLNKEANDYLNCLINDEQFCKQNKILLLLDGYDESSLDEQCLHLKSYLFGSTVDKPLLFHVVITTRKGYLSNLHGFQGRFIFAEVLGFPTKMQKEKYISNHFHSTEIDYKENIAAVHRLLAINRNLNKIAETPLLLTFICLVHERIVDGTLVELYSNIIWWLIDRYQKNYPDRDIPVLFGFQNDSGHKFKTIQDHYLHFPQLHRVSKMALHNVEKNVFGDSDYQQFNIQPIIEHVGLLGKEEKHDESFKLVTSYFFPHRTIQEFLAAFYYFYSDDQTNPVIKKALIPTNSKLVINNMNEFQKFLLRISLSDKIPMNMDKRKIYFESKTDLQINIKFDAFNTTSGFNNQLLDRLISQCTNITNIELHGKTNTAKNENTSHMLGRAPKRNGSNTGAVSAPIQLAFQSYANLLSSSIQNCTFNANSQLTFTNCSSLKSIKFAACNTKSSILNFSELPVIDTAEFSGCSFSADSQLSFTNCPSLTTLSFNHCGFSTTNISIATSSAIDTVRIDQCKIDLATLQSITDQISNSTVTCLQLIFGDFNKEFLIHLQTCSNIEQMDITIQKYNIRQNDLLSFNDLIKLHSLTFLGWTFSSNSQLSFANCPSLKNLTFDLCKFDLATWQSITDQISNSSVTCLQLTFGKGGWGNGEDFNKEFLIHLQTCSNIEQMDITIKNCTIRRYDLLSFSDLIKLHSLTNDKCTFAANSQLSFTNCPSLKYLKFSECKMKRGTIFDITTLPAIETLTFEQCLFEANSQLSFGDMIKLHSLTLAECTFSANCQLSFTNCSSLIKLIFRECEMNSSSIVGIATLPAIHTVQFDRYCSIDMAAWQSITDQISNSNVKYLQLTFGRDFNKEFLIHLPRCNNVEQMDITLQKYNIRQNDLLSFSHLITLHSLTFGGKYGSGCTFSVNSQLSFTNCPSLKNLQFLWCQMKSSTNLGIATLPAIHTVQFDQCKIDLATWQSITDQISSSNVKSLHLSADFFLKETYPEFLHHLQKCERLQHIHVYDDHDVRYHEELVTANLALTAQKLPSLTSITISNEYGETLPEWRRLSERNRERIEKAGQQTNPHFSIKYVKKDRF